MKKEIEDIHKELILKDREIEYYKRLAKKAGDERLREIEELSNLTAALKEKNQELEKALLEVKTLSGLLPICSSCKKIRDDKGYWKQIESYIRDHSEAEFSHGICPDCMNELYHQYLPDDDEK